MITVGTTVRVLPPFAEAFPGTFTVDLVTPHPDGQVACTLSDGAGAFDPRYLALDIRPLADTEAEG
jgi:hypothetical protein